MSWLVIIGCSSIISTSKKIYGIASNLNYIGDLFILYLNNKTLIYQSIIIIFISLSYSSNFMLYLQSKRFSLSWSSFHTQILKEIKTKKVYIKK